MAHMYKVTISGRTASVISYGEREKERTPRSITSLAKYINSEIEITNGTTVGDLIYWLGVDAEFYSVLFYDQLGGHDLKVFLDQANKPANEPDEDEKERIEYMEIFWNGESDTFDDGETDTCIIPDFVGRGKDETGTMIAYGISFTRLEDLMILPIKLDHTFEILCYNHKAPIGEGKFKNMNLGKRGFTVHDVYSAILNEISFHGYPQDGHAAKLLADIDQQMEGIRNGEVKLIPFEDAMKEIKDKLQDGDNDDTKQQ